MIFVFAFSPAGTGHAGQSLPIANGNAAATTNGASNTTENGQSANIIGAGPKSSK